MSLGPKTLGVKESFSPQSSLRKRKFFKRLPMVSLPNLIEAQTNSYDWFLKEGLRELLDEINPIKDFTGKDLELSFGDYYLDEPKYDEKTSKSKNISFEAPLRSKVNLLNKNANVWSGFTLRRQGQRNQCIVWMPKIVNINAALLG